LYSVQLPETLNSRRTWVLDRMSVSWICKYTPALHIWHIWNIMNILHILEYSNCLYHAQVGYQAWRCPLPRSQHEGEERQEIAWRIRYRAASWGWRFPDRSDGV
jgi:hypothetical protein